MSLKTVLLIILLIWGLPSTYFRSKFRKIIYNTNDWKINIKPIFLKEIRGLLFNILPNDKKYIKSRNDYRIYLCIYLILFILYSNIN
jgi:thioredoxin-dependent peroxiredoxin